MGNEVHLEDIIIDCFDEATMQRFYSSLFGWEKQTAYGHLAVKNASGLLLIFIHEADFVPPVWPEEVHQQQKQLHFDFEVQDVKPFVLKALALGGKMAHEQFGGEQWTTMLDPSGHPFCLCRQEND